MKYRVVCVVVVDGVDVDGGDGCWVCVINIVVVVGGDDGDNGWGVINTVVVDRRSNF